MIERLFCAAIALSGLAACGEASFDSASPRHSAKASPEGQGTDAADGSDGGSDGAEDKNNPSSGNQTVAPSDGGGGSGDSTGPNQGKTSTDAPPPDGIQVDDGNVSDKCDVPKGTPQSQVILGGEDVPGNGFVGGPDKGPLGSDFDDFLLTLKGDVLVEKDAMGAYAKIGITKASTLSVDYARGTSDCSHGFKFLLRKCPNKNSTVTKTFEFNPGAGSAGHFDFTAPAGQFFLDIEMDVSSSVNHKYGGCTLPFPVVNLLYGGGVAALVLGP